VQQQRPREGRARSWQLTWASFAAALLLSPAPAAYAEQSPASAPAATARATGRAAPTAARLHVVGTARAGSPTTIRAALPAHARVRGYRWHFDDARKDVTGAGTPTLVRHTFRTSGRHEVRLTLTGARGPQTRVTLRLHVAGALRPAGAATAPTAPMAPSTPPTTASGSTRSTRLTVLGRGDRAERDGWSARDENTVFRFGGDTRGANRQHRHGSGRAPADPDPHLPVLRGTHRHRAADLERRDDRRCVHHTRGHRRGACGALVPTDGRGRAACDVRRLPDPHRRRADPAAALVLHLGRWDRAHHRPAPAGGASTNRCRTPTTRSAGTCWKRRSWTTTVDCSSLTR